MANRSNAQAITLPASTEILIVGAGPAGLALAGELRRFGTNPLIVDRQSEGANTSRACVIHARTLEVLEPLGVTRDLLNEGAKVPIFRVRDRDRALLTIDFAQIASPYNFTVIVTAGSDRAIFAAAPGTTGRQRAAAPPLGYAAAHRTARSKRRSKPQA